jgi:hypothetical protein
VLAAQLGDLGDGVFVLEALDPDACERGCDVLGQSL